MLPLIPSGRPQTRVELNKLGRLTVPGELKDQLWDDSGGPDLSIHVFLVAGQSNAAGASNGSGPTPTAGTAYQFKSSDGSIIALADPLADGPGAPYGSMWPQFAITYNAETGRKVCIVQAAGGGTALDADVITGNDNWSPTGGLRGTAVSRCDAAMAALVTAGYVPTLKGICWMQGESDGSGVNASQTTGGEYETNLAALITYFRTELGANLPFYVWKVGVYTVAVEAGYIAIQDAQENVVAADPTYTKMVFRGGPGFAPRGMLEVDGVHWNQAAQDEAGAAGAAAVINGYSSASADLIISTVEATGVTLSAGEEAAIQAFVLALKKASDVWDRIATMHGYIGGTANAHKVDWKTPAGTLLTYAGTMTHDANGVTGGASGEITLAFAPGDLPANSLAFGALWRTHDEDSRMLAYDAGEGVNPFCAIGPSLAGDAAFDNAYNSGNGRVLIANASTIGFFVSSRTTAAVHKGFKDGVQIGSTNTGAQGTVSAFDFRLAMLAGVNVAFDCVASGLLDTKVVRLTTAVDDLQTALGR